MNLSANKIRGFTLIELSIVLVIIGLIVGGVLVGRDLISAAAVRSQIAQIEKYHTAVNTFRGKYNNYLPGDIPEPHASQFGFIARDTTTGGRGDGNGIVSGNNNAFLAPDAFVSGEFLVFWRDLSTAKLIDGSFSTATASTTTMFTTLTSIPLLVPQASIGRGNFIYVYEAYPSCCPATGTGVNYFGLSAIVASSVNALVSNPGLSVQQAYNIDKKIDDGLPKNGKTIAGYVNGQPYAPYWASTTASGDSSATSAAAASSTSCYDNNNTSGVVQQYSITQSSGNGVNCGLSFKF